MEIRGKISEKSLFFVKTGTELPQKRKFHPDFPSLRVIDFFAGLYYNDKIKWWILPYAKIFPAELRKGRAGFMHIIRTGRTPRQKRRFRKGLSAFLIVAGAALFCVLFSFYTGSGTTLPTGTDSRASAQPESSPSSAVSSRAVSSEESSAPQVGLSEASSPLWIQVTLADQNVTVFDSENRVVESFVCSSGEEGSETPKGTYRIQERGESFFSKTYQEGAYYWTQFQGDFLFHSIPFDKNKEIKTQEAGKLGTKASHGCIRLSIENAKWIYDHIPRGTKVVIE